MYRYLIGAMGGLYVAMLVCQVAMALLLVTGCGDEDTGAMPELNPVSTPTVVYVGNDLWHAVDQVDITRTCFNASDPEVVDYAACCPPGYTAVGHGPQGIACLETH